MTRHTQAHNHTERERKKVRTTVENNAFFFLLFPSLLSHSFFFVPFARSLSFIAGLDQLAFADRDSARPRRRFVARAAVTQLIGDISFNIFLFLFCIAHAARYRDQFFA